MRASNRCHACTSQAQAVLLAVLVLLDCSIAPALAYRSRRHTAHIADTPISGGAAETAAKHDSSQKTHINLHTPFNSEASLQIAARQRLFDYAVSEALDILDIAAKKIKIPEYKTTIDIPVIGGIDVSVSNVNITNLQVPRELAKVAIESGYYHLKASNLTAQVRVCMRVCWTA